MTTTDHFQKKPDFYTNREECKKDKWENIQTNSRYSDYNQVHFTAGDSVQFEIYRGIDLNGKRRGIPYTQKETKEILKENVYKDIPPPTQVSWRKYYDITTSDVSNTFRYLFDKFKKAIFVKIVDGELKVFLPFSKKHFKNEWSDRIKFDPKYASSMEDAMIGFFRHSQAQTEYKFSPKSVNRNIDEWYANNFLLRYEFPQKEGDTNTPHASDMLRTLCKERTLPDLEFFLNRRDFPLMKTDGTEPYHHLYDSENFPLLSHDYTKYAPVLSTVGGKNFADIPIPTGDDWARVCSKEGKFFSGTCDRGFNMESTTSWKNKKNIAVFRGSSTGYGITPETNMRLKISKMSKDNPSFLDAGITSWNTRPRKLMGRRYLEVPDKEELKKDGIDLVPFMDVETQTTFKYIVHIDGHVSAFRLSLELESGCCLLIVDSEYKMWFKDMLKPYVHYVPVKADLSDLLTQIEWCRKNDKKCQEISVTAKKFADIYLTKKGILDYLQNLFFEIKKVNGYFIPNFISVPKLLISKEMELLNIEALEEVKISTSSRKISRWPENTRYYSYFKGIENGMREAGFLEEEILSTFKNRTIFKSSTTQVQLYDVDKEFKLVEKIKSSSPTHEIFVSRYINDILQYIPNFCYTFTSDSTVEKSRMYTEYISEQTFADWINSREFNIHVYLKILVQICLALQVAQRYLGFVHHDLKPWNIMLKKYDIEMTTDYVVDPETVYRVRSTIVPIIVDYGNSHIVVEGVHYGNGIETDPFSMSTVQDVITILISSCSAILTSPLNESEKNVVLHIMNFIQKTGYCKGSFFNIPQVKNFIRHEGKHDVLTSSNKYELENRTPLDFVKWIDEIERGIFEIPEKLFYINSFGLASETTDYMSGKKVEVNNEHYIRSIEAGLKCFDVDFTTTRVLSLGLADTVKTCIVPLLKKIEKSKDYNRIKDKVVSVYENFKKGDFIDAKEEDFDCPPEWKISKDIFEADRILECLDGYNGKLKVLPPDYVEFILSTCLKNGIEDDVELNSVKKFLKVRKGIVDFLTVKTISNELFRYNLDMVGKDSTEYIEKCKKIISLTSL